jgi:radical SAM/Cys-rich protein
MTISATTVPITVQGANAFDEAVEEATDGPLRGATIETVQINITLECNLACRHCHVESSPKRKEAMDWETLEDVLDAARRAEAKTIDITGGAPEMNPHFRRFVKAAREQGFEVMVRTNLTILLHDGYEDMPEFCREHGVHLVASLPCYMEKNVNRQRGLRVFQESVDVIQKLNAVGYGRCDELPLDLVYNPLGPSLPPPEKQLEADYRRVLKEQFDIDFTRLIAITNLPIGRFQHDLEREGGGAEYLKLLRDSFNPATVDGLMCRHQLHVGHDGTLYDCDFNYALGLAAHTEDNDRLHVRDFDPTMWRHRRIATGEHCFGCTAGSGSSCGGALT